MIVGMLFICLFLLFLYIIISPLVSSPQEVENIHLKFELKLNRLLKNVTDIEWSLYRKIFHKIKYTLPEFYKVTMVNGDIFSVDINNLTFNIEKIENKYESTGLTIKNNDEVIELNPPKEQVEIYDLFVNYIIWKLDMYYKEQEENEKRQLSKEHQELVKKALKNI